MQLTSALMKDLRARSTQADIAPHGLGCCRKPPMLAYVCINTPCLCPIRATFTLKADLSRLNQASAQISTWARCSKLDRTGTRSPGVMFNLGQPR